MQTTLTYCLLKIPRKKRESIEFFAFYFRYKAAIRLEYLRRRLRDVRRAGLRVMRPSE